MREYLWRHQGMPQSQSKKSVAGCTRDGCTEQGGGIDQRAYAIACCSNGATASALIKSRAMEGQALTGCSRVRA
eukprot:m.847976 g.847976  ORF g.847976 m.847976 type:complete len:74 (+) comp23487_c2_seq13:4115-4336(+)